MDIDQIPDDGVLLADQDEDFIREFAMKLVGEYVPSTTGDASFSEIAKDYGGAGTTCGYLCHWLMWRLGLRDPHIVNREEPDDGLHYVPGANISRIFNNKYFVHFKAGTVPGNGDIVFLSNGPPDTEHVFVSSNVDGNVWSGANAGQTDPKDGKQCSIFIDRNFSNGGLTYKGVHKGVVGWIDISTLLFTSNATLNTAG